VVKSSSFKFGTVGSPIATPARPGGTVGGIQYAASIGLEALELAWVNGVRVGEATCAAIQQAGMENGIALSVHAPYYINLNGDDEKWPRLRTYLMDAAHFGNLAGATDIIFHPGTYFGRPVEQVLEVAIPRLRGCVEELRAAGNPVTLRPEISGKAAMLGSLVGVAMPNFWLGPLLIILFALKLEWLPVAGNEARFSIVLPALTLGLGLAAILSRMTRSSVLEVLSEDYVLTARAKGLPERTVILKHVLRNALMPVITIVGLQAGGLLSGAIITETVFAWPGIGSLLVNAIQARDYPLVQGCVLVISVSYVIVNLAADLAYALVDPRIRLEGRS